MNEIEAGRLLFFVMEKKELLKVLESAAAECGCTVAELDFNDEDNVFDVTIDKPQGDVSLEECEHVHRAVLAAFDRDVEDYALTVGSRGIAPDEADEILSTMKE